MDTHLYHGWTPQAVTPERIRLDLEKDLRHFFEVDECEPECQACRRALAALEDPEISWINEWLSENSYTFVELKEQDNGRSGTEIRSEAVSEAALPGEHFVKKDHLRLPVAHESRVPPRGLRRSAPGQGTGLASE